MRYYEQEEFVKGCLECDGFNSQCEYHTSKHKIDKSFDDDMCMWYKVIDNDLVKLKEGKENLTFDKLEGILMQNKKGT